MKPQFKFQTNKQYHLKVDNNKTKKYRTMPCFLSRTILELNNCCLTSHLVIDLLKPFKVVNIYKNTDKGTVSLRVVQGKISGWFKTVENGESINWNEYISNNKD